MTFPVTIPVGRSGIPLHVVTELLAFFFGFRYFLWGQKRTPDPLPARNRAWVTIACIFGALAGSRLLGGLEDPPALAASAHPWLYFYQNKTVLGGLLGGLIAVEAVKKGLGEKNSSGDALVYPLLLGMIIGRIGCFSMGIYEATYGLPTRSAWGMDLGDGLRRHPVALYEIAFLAVLWLVLRGVERPRKLPNGVRFKIFLIAYCAFRFFLDFIKPRYIWRSIELSSIQVAALLGLLYYFSILVLRPAWRTGKTN